MTLSATTEIAVGERLRKFHQTAAVWWNFLSLSPTAISVEADRVSFPTFSNFSCIAKFDNIFRFFRHLKPQPPSAISQFLTLFKYFHLLPVSRNRLPLRFKLQVAKNPLATHGVCLVLYAKILHNWATRRNNSLHKACASFYKRISDITERPEEIARYTWCVPRSISEYLT